MPGFHAVPSLGLSDPEGSRKTRPIREAYALRASRVADVPSVDRSRDHHNIPGVIFGNKGRLSLAQF